ncbi:MAG: proton-conducting transporter membrane subunit [bacterium]|nr:proton-conducting transporter membrane subunit [bacterium]
MNVNIWFLPVVISFGIAFVHLLIQGAGRNIRKWVSLLGVLAVLFSCFYSMYVNYDILSSGEKLGLLFAILISFIGLCSVSFSQWYNSEVNFVYDGLLFLFLGGMLGVVLSHSLIALYIYWEIMTIASFFLVLFADTDEARSASLKYIIMTGVGSIFLLFGILGIWLLEENLLWKHIFFFSILLGTGVKVGIFLLNSWLPDAYTSAQTPISALFSGAMSKTGIYALIRFYFVIFKPSWSIGWETVMLLLGIFTLLGGVFLALIQHDIKRLLAYHSISQIGYIFLGIACGTQIGLVGALYHTINHAIFKSLLFLGAGVLIKATGSRNLEDYGGLFRKLPVTFMVMTVAAFSISGIPPFNGFVSKWIIYQALLIKNNPISTFAFIAALLGSVLTLASFVKVINDSFMGVRKKEITGEKLEGSPFMNIPMILLAIGCLLFGLYPGFVTEKFLFPAIGEYVMLNINLIQMASYYGVLAIIILALLFVVGRRWIKQVRRTEVFVGGEVISDKITAFDGAHFYGTVKEITPLKKFYTLDTMGLLDIYQNFLKLLPNAGKFFINIAVMAVDFIYNRGSLFLNLWVERLKLLQNGLLAKYLVWFFAGLIIIMEVIRR